MIPFGRVFARPQRGHSGADRTWRAARLHKPATVSKVREWVVCNYLVEDEAVHNCDLYVPEEKLSPPLAFSDESIVDAVLVCFVHPIHGLVVVIDYRGFRGVPLSGDHINKGCASFCSQHDHRLLFLCSSPTGHKQLLSSVRLRFIVRKPEPFVSHFIRKVYSVLHTSPNETSVVVSKSECQRDTGVVSITEHRMTFTKVSLGQMNNYSSWLWKFSKIFMGFFKCVGTSLDKDIQDIPMLTFSR